MSAIAQAHPSAHHGHADDKFKIFVNTAMILAVITGVEIGIVYLPWAKWIIIAWLVVLSVVKFMMVIFIFMHLRWDKPFCTILFFIGLVLSVATVWALLALFKAEASLPITLLPIPPLPALTV
jgi:cytochrome c oxidase subunit 4